MFEDLYTLMLNPPSLSDWFRYVAKVDAENWTGCWLWTASRVRKGYGGFWCDGKPARASRIMSQWVYGTGGEAVDHLVCSAPLCCNPLHLLPGTVQANNSRRVRGQTHCLNRHELTDDNLHKDLTGRRVCRTCKNARKRAARAAKKLAPTR